MSILALTSSHNQQGQAFASTPSLTMSTTISQCEPRIQYLASMSTY